MWIVVLPLVLSGCVGSRETSGGVGSLPSPSAPPGNLNLSSHVLKETPSCSPTDFSRNVAFRGGVNNAYVVVAERYTDGRGIPLCPKAKAMALHVERINGYGVFSIQFVIQDPTGEQTPLGRFRGDPVDFIYNVDPKYSSVSLFQYFEQGVMVGYTWKVSIDWKME